MKTLCRFAVAGLFFCSTVLSLHAETIVALTSDKKLRHFSSTTPNAWLKTVDITGIPAAESVVALDFRPDGSLVVLTREGTAVRPYNVNPNTGAAVVGGVLLTFASGVGGVAFDACSIDARSTDLVAASEDDSFHRFFVRPSSAGGLATKTLAYDNSSSDGDPVDEHAGANPSIVALASTNGFVGAESTVYYGIDSIQNSLVKLTWEDGSLDTVATLRTSGGATVGIALRTGFDISGVTGTAYIAQGPSFGDTTSLLTVDLTTGIATTIGPIGPQIQQVGVNVVDISTLPPTNLNNISTRSRVGTGEDVMIAGFISQGGASNRLLIRGLGPSLGAFGVNGPLSDPVLTVKDANGIQIATNDSWRSNQQTEILQTGLQPGNDLEAAILGTFPPGQYSATVSGKDGGTGVGIVEIYKLPNL